MSDSTTTFAAALKQFYSRDRVNELLYEVNPAYKNIRKESQANGLDYYRVPLITAPGGSTSSTFSVGQSSALANSIGVQQFNVTRTSTYAFGYLSDILMQASKGSAAAFVDASKANVKGVVYQLGRDISIAMYRDGWGTRGRLSSGTVVSGATITLSNKSDVFNFEVGDQLAFNVTKGDAAKANGSSGVPLTIQDIDQDAGTLTFPYNLNDATNGCPTIAASDWIYKAGDAILNTRTKLVGFDGWLPDVNNRPTISDSFFGQNRFVNSQKLAGVAVDGRNKTLIDALRTTVIKVAQVGGNADQAYLSYAQFDNLLGELEGKVRIATEGMRKDQQIGFPSVEVITPKGKCTVIADINCPDDHMYVLQSDTWKIMNLGSDPVYSIGSEGGDGLFMRAAPTSDNWEIRYRFSGGLGCTAPGWNASVLLTAP